MKTRNVSVLFTLAIVLTLALVVPRLREFAGRAVHTCHHQNRCGDAIDGTLCGGR